MGHNFVTLLSRWLVVLRVNATFGDYQVGWFKQVTLLHSDLIRQVSLYIISTAMTMLHLVSKVQHISRLLF